MGGFSISMTVCFPTRWVLLHDFQCWVRPSPKWGHADICRLLSSGRQRQLFKLSLSLAFPLWCYCWRLSRRQRQQHGCFQIELESQTSMLGKSIQTPCCMNMWAGFVTYWSRGKSFEASEVPGGQGETCQQGNTLWHKADALLRVNVCCLLRQQLPFFFCSVKFQLFHCCLGKTMPFSHKAKRIGNQS